MRVTERTAQSRELDALSDEEVVARVRSGQIDLFEVLMRRYDQRVYRLVRSVLRNDSEAEDVTQEAWVRAYAHLNQFAGLARFSTWLGRIALHEAWARRRKGERWKALNVNRGVCSREMKQTSVAPDLEEQVLGQEVQSFVEAAVDALPEGYRTVFVLRQIEGLSTTQTAEHLELSEEAVKTRLIRARAVLKRELLKIAGAGIKHAFPFLGDRCDRMFERVLARIRAGDVGNSPLVQDRPRPS